MRRCSFFSSRITFATIICFAIIFLSTACQKKTADRLTVDGPKTFVVLGSSTAFGTGASSSDSSWVGLLAAKFARDKKDFTVVNLAVSGFTTYQILPGISPGTAQRPGSDQDKNV